MKDTNPTLKMLAQRFVARSEQLGYKGKQRDTMTMEFFVGCCIALDAAGHEDAPCVLASTAYLIATRGYGEVVRLASEEERKAS